MAAPEGEGGGGEESSGESPVRNSSLRQWYFEMKTIIGFVLFHSVIYNSVSRLDFL